MTGPPLPRDFPDRAIRDGLVHAQHLRALLRRVAPEIADRLDYARLEIVPRSYLLDDWRKREADILIRLPLLGGEGGEVLVCILIEHQSSADPVMPLRLLLYAVLHWEQQWRAWEQRHDYGEPLRLTPILPVVLHTGQELWNTNRSVSELFAGPEELRAWAPQWPARLFDLPAQPATALLQAPEEWWQALAVVRAEWSEPAEFASVFAEAVRRLESMAQQDRVGWQQLVRMMLYWGLFRRPTVEHAGILELVRNSVTNVELMSEVETMAKQMQPTYEQELLAKGEQRGEARGEARGEQRGQLKAYRTILRKQLERQFAPLPENVLQQIEAADLPWLEAALDRVESLGSLDDLGV
jgi:Putative transposase, YhgA-like